MDGAVRLSANLSLSAHLCLRCARAQLRSYRQHAARARRLHDTARRPHPSLATESSLPPNLSLHYEQPPTNAESIASSEFDGQRHRRNVLAKLRRWDEQFMQAQSLGSDKPTAVSHPSSSLTATSVEIDDEQDGDDFEYFAEHSDSEVIRSFGSIALRVGDLWQVPKPEVATPVLAVCLAINGQFHVSYTTNATLLISTNRRQRFAISNFASLEDLAPILSCLPETYGSRTDIHVPPSKARETLQRMRALLSRVQDYQKRYSAHLGSLFETVAHETEYRKVSLEDLARKVQDAAGTAGEKISDELLLAVSEAILTRQYGFRVFEAEYRMARVAQVQPKSVVRMVMQGREMIRAYQDERSLSAAGRPVPNSVRKLSSKVKLFLQKSCALIARSRELRMSAPNYSVLKTRDDVDLNGTDEMGYIELDSFSESDKALVHLLLASYGTGCFATHQALQALPMVLVRATGMYQDVPEFLQSTIGAFLVEIGVLQPWQYPRVLEHGVKILDQSLQKEMETRLQKVKSGATAEEAFELRDRYEGDRKEWGDLEAITIDPDVTKVCDDALSVEPVEGTDAECWVHVHIAHPSAYFAPGSFAADLVRDNWENLAFSGGQRPIMPWAMNEYLSLKPGGSAVTISVRTNTEGAILETKLQHSTIGRLSAVPREVFDDIVGLHDRPKRKETVITVGHDRAERDHSKDRRPLSDSVTEIVRRLHQVSQWVRKGRKTDVDKSLLQYPQPLITDHPDRANAWLEMGKVPERARFSLRDPGLKFGLLENEVELLEAGAIRPHEADHVNEEMMVLANRAVASWAAQRNIPLPFVGTQAQGAYPDKNAEAVRQQAIKDIVDDKIKWSGSRVTFLMKLRDLPFHSIKPVEHAAVNGEPYCKVTSPLRRYADMLTWWQVDAAMQEEKRKGASLIGCNTHSYLPYSAEELQDEMSTLLATNCHRSLVRATHAYGLFVNLLARAFYLGEGTLPDTFTVLVSDDNHLGKGWPLRIDGTPYIAHCAEGQTFENGEVPQKHERWEAKLKSVLVCENLISMTLTRKLEDAPTWAKPLLYYM